MFFTIDNNEQWHRSRVHWNSSSRLSKTGVFRNKTNQMKIT